MGGIVAHSGPGHTMAGGKEIVGQEGLRERGKRVGKPDVHTDREQHDMWSQSLYTATCPKGAM